ncbi:MAG: prephenate dehydratase [Opitutales bacterium]|nr:prephenate dehydratase [Opitutales bacterium]
MNEELEALRKEIDKCDQQIVETLNKRSQVACQIGRIKAEVGGAIYDPSREEKVFGKIEELSGGPLKPDSLRAIYREIISAAKSLEGPAKIAYLGPEASYTNQAALGCFGSSMDYQAVSSIPEIFTLVEKGDADYGVVPIENSTDGIVRHSLDMLVNTHLYIVNQNYLTIEHCLISNSPLEEIEMVCSKDQALGQCRDWLLRHLPGVDQKEVASTSLAVTMAKKDKGVAAIASSLASELYEVPIVQRNVQDRTDNITRFLVIGKEPTKPLGDDQDRTSIVVSLKDEVGALQNALNIFSSHKINLCKIESRPTRQKSWDYFFFIDFIGHYEDASVQRVMDELRSKSSFVKWLGSYPMV